jgi:hypothetical protein
MAEDASANNAAIAPKTQSSNFLSFFNPLFKAMP